MIFPYNRRYSVAYAERWAFSRNPLFYDFSDIGGNCTNFVSQCILAGCCTMNFTETFGWYYISAEDRAPAWTGVEFLYNFLTSNVNDGPFGIEADTGSLQLGDVIQLGNGEGEYYHTLLICGFRRGDVLVAAQTDNAFARPLSSYSYAAARGIHILGSRRSAPVCNCFKELYDGSSLLGCL